MKLLPNSRAVKGIQELINKCASKEGAPGRHCGVRKLGKHKTRMGHEMRLTVKTGDYEMDHVILDLGPDVNVFPK